MAIQPKNWQKRYRIQFGVPAYETTSYYAEGSLIEGSIAARVSATQSIPSDALMISNIPEDGNPLRGFDFNLATKRSLSSNSTKSETSTLSIKNITPEMYDLFTTNGCVVVVEAGYRDNGVDVVYKGFVQRVDVTSQGNDVVYMVQMKDAGIDVKSAKVSVDYPETMSAEEVLKSLVKFFPSVATSKINISTLRDLYVAGGFSFEGKLIDNVERFCEAYGIDYSFFNGNFVAISKDVTQGDDTYNELEPNTFVFEQIDIKNIEAVNDNSTKSVNDSSAKRDVMLTTFLTNIGFDNFFTVPELTDKSLSGTYKINTIAIQLDSRGNEWNTILIGSPM